MNKRTNYERERGNVYRPGWLDGFKFQVLEKFGIPKK
jgi:hypothetical protein